MSQPNDRREFLKLATGAAAVGTLLPAGLAWAKPMVAEPATATTGKSPVILPETMVQSLYESFSPKQREVVCFDWDHVDKKRGLLRTRVANNWDITNETINSKFFTDDQRHMVRSIFEGIYNPDWHKRIDQQLDDDSAGYGENNSIAIFGDPGSDKFEFVLTGRHMTVRCDGNSAEHVAFGGPIFYGHAADGFNEGPDHKGNVFWPQALAANKLYQALDGKQQEQALVRRGMPREQKVAFQGKAGKFQGIALRDLAADQKEHVQSVLKVLLEPYRKTDRDEAMACLLKQGGLDACHLAYYAQSDLGKDKVWDSWRIEGPSFVWHYRGSPHVHVWVNIADDASVKLNA